MSSSSTTPTPAQIQQVQTNLGNIQAWNGYVYTHRSTANFSNAFGLLSYEDNSDLGLTVGLNFLGGVCAAVGGLFGPVGAFAGTFLPGMLSSWATSSPPSDLPETFGSLAERLEGMSQSLDNQLAGYAADVPGNWNETFTYGDKTAVLSDLANISFPVETDPDFFTLTDVAIPAMEQWIWRSVLQERYVITKFAYPGHVPGTNLQDPEGPPPTSWAESIYYPKNPAYSLSFYWGEVDIELTEWCFTAYNIGTGVSEGYDGEGSGDGGMSIPACNYLFLDSTPCTKGLYTRDEVFNSLDIPTATHNGYPPG